VHIINRSPTRSLKGVTPYEAWRRKKPKVDYFRTFGCVAYFKVVGPGLTKLSDRARAGVFVGYEDGAKAYRVFDPIGNRLHITRDVIFQEDQKWDWSTAPGEVHSSEKFTVVYSDDTELSVSSACNLENAQETPDPLFPPNQSDSCTSPVSSCSDVTAAASSSCSPADHVRAAAPPPLPTHPMRTLGQAGIFMPNPLVHRRARTR
jgi:hypothetical protein